MTLADALSSRQIDSIDLLKIDIEGFEYEAILGCPELFRNKTIKAIALGLHHHILVERGKSPDAITGFLQDAGYNSAPEFPGYVWTTN